MPTTPKLENLPDVLTIKQVAKVLQITENHAYDLVAKGKIPALRFSRRCIRIPRRALERLLELSIGEPIRLQFDSDGNGGTEKEIKP